MMTAGGNQKDFGLNTTGGTHFTDLLYIVKSEIFF